MSREEKALQIANDIILLSRNTLLVNFRFLDRSLSNLKPVADDNFALETDGSSLFFGPWFILSQYKSEQNVVTRDILHSLLHCIFCHSFIGKNVDRQRWDLACDIAVENIIGTLEANCVRAKRESAQSQYISLLTQNLDILSAEKIYHFLMNSSFPDEEISDIRQHFLGDNHNLWYGDSAEDAKIDEKVQLKKIWEEISKRMQTELEMIEKDSSSVLIQNLKSLNRARYSYTEFLRRFGIHGEIMQISDEEFDNNYYTYGLDLYGNIPLIEPLEYSEQKRIREFVIAIDTSGSVKGDVVQSFIQHTHDILMQQQSFFTKINLHIIQCDHVIREDAVISSKEAFDRYLSTMELKGFETTDFRPVFSYVDSLIESRELKNLQGLIYFTDGRGTFPSSKPGYDVAFIINRDDFNEPAIPVWAQHMTLSEEDILDKRFSN